MSNNLLSLELKRKTKISTFKIKNGYARFYKKIR